MGSFFYVRWLSIDHTKVYRDSKVVIDWVLRKTKFSLPLLINLMKRINMLIDAFQDLTFEHIYRE